MTPVLSLILPSYNEAGNIEKLLAGYRRVAGRFPIELILVDNGSTDDTPRILKEELARPGNSFARAVRVPSNIGYGHGLKEGLKAASSPLLSFSHADLQYSPEDIVMGYDLYREQQPQGPCLVKGRRVGPRPLADRCVSFAFNGLARRLLGLEAQDLDASASLGAVDVNGEPKIFDRALLGDLNGAPNDFSFDLFVLEMARRRGWRILEFDAAYGTRDWGASKLAANPWVRFKTAARAFRVILALRAAPRPGGRAPRL